MRILIAANEPFVKGGVIRESTGIERDRRTFIWRDRERVKMTPNYIDEWVDISLEKKGVLQMGSKPGRLASSAIDHQNRHSRVYQRARKCAAHRPCTND